MDFVGFQCIFIAQWSAEAPTSSPLLPWRRISRWTAGRRLVHRGTLSRVNAWRRGAPECSRAHRGSNGQLWASQSEKKTEKKKKKKNRTKTKKQGFPLQNKAKSWKWPLKHKPCEEICSWAYVFSVIFMILLYFAMENIVFFILGRFFFFFFYKKKKK